MEEKSIRDKLEVAYEMAHILANRFEEKGQFPDDRLSDIIWTHLEGLRADRLLSIIAGRCSLKTALEFDLSEEEALLDMEIKIMSEYGGQI